MKANKVIRLVSGCLLVVAMMAIFWACNKESISEPSGSDVLTTDVEINKVVQNYFDKKNDLIIGGATQEEKSGFIETTSNAKNARKAISEYLLLGESYKESNISVKKIKTQIKIDEINKLEKDKYYLIVSTITKTFTNSKDITTGEPITPTEAYVYGITIAKIDNNWLIQKDELLTLIGEEKYLNSLIERVNDDIPQVKSSRVQGGVYLRSSSVAYAREYAEKYISCTSWFLPLGGDCTNFISSCLLVRGGWQQDGTWWIKSCSNASYAWGGAHPFRNYLLNSNRIFPNTTNVNNLQVGDIISYEWHGDNSFDHTVMVTKKDYSGIYLSYHTTNTLDLPLNTFIARVMSQRGRIPTANPFRLKDSY